MTPPCHRRASHLSPVKGELPARSRWVAVIFNTLDFHHLHSSLVEIEEGTEVAHLFKTWKDEERKCLGRSKEAMSRMNALVPKRREVNIRTSFAPSFLHLCLDFSHSGLALVWLCRVLFHRDLTGHTTQLTGGHHFMPLRSNDIRYSFLELSNIFRPQVFGRRGTPRKCKAFRICTRSEHYQRRSLSTTLPLYHGSSEASQGMLHSFKKTRTSHLLRAGDWRILR